MLNTAELRCLYIIDWFMKNFSLSAEQASAFAGSFAFLTDGTFSLSPDESKYGIAKWYKDRMTRLGVDTEGFNDQTLSTQLEAFSKEISAEGNVGIEELSFISDTRSAAVIVWCIESKGDRAGFYSAMKGQESLSGDVLQVVGWTNGAYSLFYQYRNAAVDLTYGNDTVETDDKLTQGDISGTYQGDVTADSFTYTSPADLVDTNDDTGVDAKYGDLSDLTFYDENGNEIPNPYEG